MWVLDLCRKNYLNVRSWWDSFLIMNFFLIVVLMSNCLLMFGFLLISSCVRFGSFCFVVLVDF